MENERLHAGIDLSTTCCGLCVVNEAGKILYLKALDISKEHDYTLKSNIILSQIEQIEKFIGNIETITIEEALLGFMNGKTRQQTIISLIKWNAVFSYIFSLARPNIRFNRANVSTMRKNVLGKARIKGMKSKDFVKQEISNKYDLTPWIIVNKKGNEDKKMEDCRDALICAEYGRFLSNTSSDNVNTKIKNR